jgi:transcriptional regulator
MATEAELLSHLTELTHQNEAMREKPWAVSDAPDKYIQAMTRGIVGLRMKVERLEGSWKLNQHKSEADRLGVQAGLFTEADADAKSISTLMRGLESGHSDAGKA